MSINLSGMTLQQGLNAVAKLQTFLDEAVNDRVDFMEKWDIEGVNGALMAYYWREAALKHLVTELRDALVLKFDPPKEIKVNE